MTRKKSRPDNVSFKGDEAEEKEEGEETEMRKGGEESNEKENVEEV